jgi:hypothetical protein
LRSSAEPVDTSAFDSPPLGGTVLGVSTELAIAIISVVGGAVTGVASAVWGPVINQRLERRRRATEVRDRYSPPLLQAAFDLQSRLYNIVRQKFFETYLPDDSKRLGYATNSTLWLFAQYLGWGELLRREVQFLDFGRTKTNRALQEALGKVTSELASDAYGRTLAIFRAEQRAIGELMIGRHRGADGARLPVTLGYGDFVRRLADPAFGQWFERLGNELKAPPTKRSRARLVSVQRALIDIVDLLDPEYVRYPSLDTRGKLPPPLPAREAAELEVGERVARFVAYGREYGEDDRTFPAGILAAWAQRQNLERLESPEGPEWAAYRGKLGILGTDVVVQVRYQDHRIEIYGSVESPWWARAVRLAPRIMSLRGGGRLPSARHRARVVINDLLEQFARPTV